MSVVVIWISLTIFSFYLLWNEACPWEKDLMAAIAILAISIFGFWLIVPAYFLMKLFEGGKNC